MQLFKTLFYCGIFFSLIALPSLNAEETKNSTEKEPNKEPNKPPCSDKEEFSETTHQVMINGKPIDYKAVAGNLILKDEKSQSKASLFFISYTKENSSDLSERPITFCFNGGPGSSSVWLHLGILGPKRVHLNENGDPLAPYHLVDNEYSLLDVTDLVFIDPVSTGFSRAIPPEDSKKYHGIEEDVKSISEFIRLYLTRYNRWESPKFLAGESYGTTRAAALADNLHDKYFIYTNGIVLISSVLNFQTIDFNPGNDLPYLLFLPSYTATAWYHKKLSPELQVNFSQTIKLAREFAANDYAVALFKGDQLIPSERARIIGQLSSFTGLSPDYIDRCRLRVDMTQFGKELLRDQNRTIGRFDSRYKGIESNRVAENIEHDPSSEAIFGAFTSTLNHYIETDLKWTSDAHYKILTNVFPWDWGSSNQYLNVSDNLHNVMTKNPSLRIFVGSGYYDLAIPFFATDYTFDHLGLDPILKDHVTMKYYDAGHMMYTYRPALIKQKEDLANFYMKTLEAQLKEEQPGVSIQR